MKRACLEALWVTRPMIVMEHNISTQKEEVIEHNSVGRREECVDEILKKERFDVRS